MIDANKESVRTIGCGVAGNYKWTGIAPMGRKLFCAPCNASDVLMVDADSETVRAIPTGINEGMTGKWNGILATQSQLFCAPSNAFELLALEDRLSLWGL